MQRYVEPYEDRLESGDTDVVITATQPSRPWIHKSPLFESRWVCLARRSHPWLRAPTLERFVASGHVMVSPTGEGSDPLDPLLAARGLSRTPTVRVPDIVGALVFAAQTDLLVVVPETTAQRARELLDVDFRRLPLEGTEHTVYMMWHESRDNHAPLQWFRSIVEESVRIDIADFQNSGTTC